MSSVPNPTSRPLARADENKASTWWIPQAFMKAAMGLALLAGGGADARAAKPTFGLQVGAGTDLPDARVEPTDCRGPGRPGATPACGWRPLPVGRIRVPVSFALGPNAALVLRPGVDGGMVQGQLSWKRDPSCAVAGTEPCIDPEGDFYDYTGHFSVMIVPSLGAGVQVGGRLSDSVSLIGGVGASLGYVWMFQSVGVNTPGKHTITGEPLLGATSSGDHCYDKPPTPIADEVPVSCGRDLIKDALRPGVDLSFGVTWESGRKWSLEVSYSVLGAISDTPRHYDEGVVLVRYQMLNPVMLTLGTTFGG